MIEMRHANYKYLLEHNKLYSQYQDMGIKEIVGCGEFVSKMSHEALGDNPTTIKNILLPRKETNKIIRLISCTRIDKEKGWNRMLKLMDMMRNAEIKFQWDIFTNNPQNCNYEEVHFYKQRYDIWDYLANADYTVLLSDSEGLPYTVQESLQYQVPCIVTDVGGCTELIQDGINGYVVPLDMNFDINKIKKIPKCKEYNNHSLEKWLEYLEYDGPIIDKNEIIKKYKEGKEMKVKVRATKKFEGTRDAERNVIPKEGDIWETDEKRAELLAEKGYVIFEPTKTIEPEEKPVKETPKRTTRKTIAKKRKI
jgi:glycosyltransferase involved in cell wall biosynthesis